MASLPNIPSTKLNNGAQIPVLGFGAGGLTWYKPDRWAPVNPDMVTMTQNAIKAGYRHIDTAEGYGTEPELGRAIEDSDVPREQLFITTKVFQTIVEGKLEDVTTALDQSLKRLKLDYVDLYLLHTPYLRDNKYFPEDVAAAWKQLEVLQRSGKTRSIGISNFRQSQVEELLKTAEIKPVLNQVQFHPYHSGSAAYAKWLQGHGIAVEGFFLLMPLTHLKGLHLAPKLSELAAKHRVSEATVLIRWAMDLGVISLNTSTKTERLTEFFAALDLKLSEEDSAEITRIGEQNHIRISSPSTLPFDGGEVTPY